VGPSKTTILFITGTGERAGIVRVLPVIWHSRMDAISVVSVVYELFQIYHRMRAGTALGPERSMAPDAGRLCRSLGRTWGPPTRHIYDLRPGTLDLPGMKANYRQCAWVFNGTRSSFVLSQEETRRMLDELRRRRCSLTGAVCAAVHLAAGEHLGAKGAGVDLPFIRCAVDLRATLDLPPDELGWYQGLARLATGGDEGLWDMARRYSNEYRDYLHTGDFLWTYEHPRPTRPTDMLYYVRERLRPGSVAHPRPGSIWVINRGPMEPQLGEHTLRDLRLIWDDFPKVVVLVFILRGCLHGHVLLSSAALGGANLAAKRERMTASLFDMLTRSSDERTETERPPLVEVNASTGAARGARR
jgi:hypothetical protein